MQTLLRHKGKEHSSSLTETDTAAVHIITTLSLIPCLCLQLEFIALLNSNIT